MSEPWYRDGLRFTCTRCGNCCTGAPGFVWVSPEELATLADYLDQPAEQVFAQKMRVVDGEMSLIEQANGWRCFRLEDEVSPVLPAALATSR